MEADGIVRRVEAGGSTLYTLTERGEGIRTAVEELGMWGARMGRVGPPVHQRSIRAIAMALQAILVRAGDALPARADVIELTVDGESAEVVLGPSPSVTVRIPVRPTTRVATTAKKISDVLLGGSVDDGTFTLISGDEEATRRLVTALGGPHRA